MILVHSSTYIARIIGIFTISVVAAIPLLTLASDASSYLEPDGQRLLSAPLFVQALIFGTSYAAVGEMLTSFVFSFVFMYLTRSFFTHNGGDTARRFVRPNVVERIQEDIFPNAPPTVSDVVDALTGMINYPFTKSTGDSS